MMTKFISLLLSFSLIFMSVAPSYAQARAAETAVARRQYDVMKVEDCERDASGKIKKIDFTNPQNRESFERMMSSPEVWEWRSCAYVAGLKEYYETHPRQREALTYWHRHDVIYAAVEKYIKRWNNDPSARENDTFRDMMVGLNAVVVQDKGIPAYQFNSQKDIFAKVASRVEEQVNSAQKAGALGSIFGLPGGKASVGKGGADLMAEVTSVYQLLTQEPSEGASSDISYEEFAQLYKDNVRYEFSGRLAEEATQHQNDPGWSSYVSQVSQQLFGLLSDTAVRKAYEEYQVQASSGNDEFQAVMQEYLKDLSREIWAAYERTPVVWLGALQDVFPLLNMYGGLPADIRQKAAAVMRAEIQKNQSACAKPGFFSVRTLKGLGVMLTLHQNQSIKDSIASDIVKENEQCALSVKAAIALGALGAEGDDTQDSQAVQNLFKEGFNGSASGLVIPASLTVLTAMGAYKNAADMIIYAGNKTEEQELGDILGGLSPVAWAQMLQTGNSYWAEGAHLEYSYYLDENSEQRNIWVDTADLLMEAYLSADQQEQAKMEILFKRSLESLLAPSAEQLRMALRPFLAGIFSYGFVNVKLSDKDKGYVAYDQLEVLVDIHRITDKKGKKGAKEMFQSAYKAHVPYAGVIIWYLFCSNKNDLHPKMRLYLNERLAQALMTTGGSWAPYAYQELEKQEAELSSQIDNFQTWTRVKEELAPLDDLIGIFFLWQGGKGVLSLLKFIGRVAGTATTSVVKMLRMMRSVNIVKVANLGKNLNKVLKTGLKNFKSTSFARLKVSAFRRVKGAPEIPAFKPGMASSPKGVPGAHSAIPGSANESVVASAKAEIRVLNGERYVVFEGTESVYVQGSVQMVPKGKSLSSVAREYGVPIEDVAWATDGSSWAGIRSSFNFGAGEAAPGSRGVQPRMDRPDIRIPKPVSRVEPVKPAAEASMVKPGEKLAYIYENGAWRIESVPQELSRADVAKRFKINVDDVDYVVSLSDGTLAPEWTEFVDVWDVARMPHGQPVRKFEITGWNLFKARMQANWSLFTDNLFSVSDFALRNPLRASGMGLSSFGMGGVAPLSLPATVQVAPAAANPLTSFRLLGTVSEAPATLRAPASLSSSTTALQTASAAGAGLQSSRMWLNPFWLLPGGAVTSRHITPVGALPSDSFRGGSLLGAPSYSKWRSKAAFDNYRLQTDNWLFRSNPLYRAQNPWLLGQWWDDVKNSVSLGWQEFNLSRVANPYYVDFKTSLLTTPVLDAAEEPAAEPAGQTSAAAPAEPSSSSGYLYSGLPIMELPRLASGMWKTLRGLFGGKADVLAEDILSRKVPLVTELRDIVTGNANLALKKKALLRLHQQFNAFDQVVKNLPAQARANLKALEERQAAEEIGNFLYNLYETGFLDQVLPRLSNHIPTELLAQTLDEIISNPEFEATRRAVYDNTPVLSLDSNDWQGFVKSVQNVNPQLISDISRKEGWAVQNASDGKEVSGGWIYYENDIPVYYRHANGVLSDSPVIILHQEPFSSKLAGVYASFWQALHLSSQAGVKIPKGMVLALDENGKFKYVLQPGHRVELQDSKAAKKKMKKIYKDGSVAVELDTPYNPTDLLAIAKLLEAGVDVNFQLTLTASNSFKTFVYFLGILAGLGVDNVMVGPFRDAAGKDKPVVPNAFGGVGYVTPRVSAELMGSIKSWGVDRSTFTVLVGMMAVLGLSSAFGINGLVPVSEFSLLALGAPLLMLIVTGSILRSVIPLITKVYKDPRQRTVVNLEVSSFQQGSKVGLSLLTGVWKGAGKKFVAVPIAGIVTLISIGLFLNTPIGRKVLSETLHAAVKQPIQSLKSLGTGAWIVSQKMLKGFALGALTPVILLGKNSAAAFKGLVNKFKKPKEVTGAEDVAAGGDEKLSDKERYVQEYNKKFATDAEVKASLRRVSIVYASYAASLMLLNQLMESAEVDKILISWFGEADLGKTITTVFAASALVLRILASRWVKSGRFTDDQLTGISFVGLAISSLVLGFVPYDSWGLTIAVLSGIILYMSTAVPGQLDKVRLQNMVSAKIQQEKNQVLQDATLSQQEKDALLADLEAKESEWSGLANAAYDKANSNGTIGIAAAIAASLLLPAMGVEEWAWIARVIFLYAGAVALLGVGQTKEMAASFIKALFRKKKAFVITDEDIAAGQVSAASFGLTDENKVNKLVPSLMKGNDGLKALKEQVAPYGVIAIASEVKLTKVLKRMIEIHNRLVASAEVAGDAVMRASFEELHSLAADYAAVMAQSNVSVSLQREFGKLLAALCVEGSLEKGVLAKPSYMREGEFDIPANYRNLLEARDIILEMRVLVRNIRQGGSAVTPETYRRFIQYHTEAKRLLQAYMAENPSESAIVRAEEENIRKLCRGLKMSNARSNILRQQEGHVSAKDIQDLEDLLLAY